MCGLKIQVLIERIGNKNGHLERVGDTRLEEYCVI